MLDEIPEKDFKNITYKCQKILHVHARDSCFKVDILGVALKYKTISSKEYRLTVLHYVYYSQYNLQTHYLEGENGIETSPCSFYMYPW